MDARRLYILRGLPSAGKTTLAQLLAPEHNISTDQAECLLSNGTRAAEASFLEVKNKERDVVRSWMLDGAATIAVHDVNATRADVNEWILLAVCNSYQWSVVHVETDLNDADLAARSATQCPAAAIAQFRARWQQWGA